MPLKRWRQKVGIVTQDPVLFSGSIASNICFGDDEDDENDSDSDSDSSAKMARITEAARQATALTFINSFEKGFDTLCGERGVALSGGQKQVSVEALFVEWREGQLANSNLQLN